jgi:segregation and condensation protein B
MNLDARIEAVLFYKSEPVKKSWLADFFEVSTSEIEQALRVCTATLASRGVRLVMTDTSVQLVTAPEVSETIERVRKEELSGDIGKAGAETLAIVLYRGPLSRAEIDRIRGVNSTFILRNLLIRGLVERRAHPTDSRSWIYAVTPALMNHLGVESRETLPEFGAIMDALDVFEKQQAVEEVETSNPLVTG